MVEMVVKSNIGELQEELMAGSLRRMRKYFTSVVQGVSGKKRFLLRFQDWCENNISLYQLTIVIIENIPEEKNLRFPKLLRYLSSKLN